jgi:hypothetical protein
MGGVDELDQYRSTGLLFMAQSGGGFFSPVWEILSQQMLDVDV